MADPRAIIASTVFRSKGKEFIIRFIGSDSDMIDVEVLDFETDKWISIGKMSYGTN